MLHIKNALICDGTGKEPYPGEVLVDGNKIAAVGPAPLGELDAEIWDAQGELITPGFIDAHRHCDLAALYDSDFGEIELAQGITTAVMGNCGLAPVPCAPQYREDLYDFLEPCLGKAPKESFFPLVSNFMEALAAKKHSLNLGVLAATGAVTTAAKGFGNVPFNGESRKKAEGYIRDAMEAGAFGLSCGIMYTPECYSTCKDFAFMARIAGEYGGYLTAHIRGEGSTLTESVEEVLEIGRQAGTGVNVSHFKVTGLKNHGTGIERAISALEKARSAGQDATADCYPYTGGSTTILSLLPPTVLTAAGPDVCGFLGAREGEALLAGEIQKEFPGWDNMVSSIGWERIIISSAANPAWQSLAGKSFTEAARETGLSESGLFCRLCSENQGKAGIIVMSMAQADVDRVLCLPYVSLISDSLYGGGGMPHPRLYGSFPKFLREYVQEKKLLSTGEAIRKMTSLPARRLGLRDRGLLAPGMAADILQFDPARFTDRATWENPKQLASGLTKILVNGCEPASGAGKVLRREN